MKTRLYIVSIWDSSGISKRNSGSNSSSRCNSSGDSRRVAAVFVLYIVVEEVGDSSNSSTISSRSRSSSSRNSGSRSYGSSGSSRAVAVFLLYID